MLWLTVVVKPRDSIIFSLYMRQVQLPSGRVPCALRSHLWWWLWYYRHPHFMDETGHKETKQLAQSHYAREEKWSQSSARHCPPKRRAVLPLPCWLLTCLRSAKKGNVTWCGGQWGNSARCSHTALALYHLTDSVKLKEKKISFYNLIKNDQNSTTESHPSHHLINNYLLCNTIVYITICNTVM